MAQDLAEKIVEVAQQLHEKENTSYMTILINRIHKVQFEIVKLNQTVKIKHATRKITYTVKDTQLLHNLWTLILKEEISAICKVSLMIDKGVGIAYYKTKDGPLAIFDKTTENYINQSTKCDNIIDFAVLVCNPNLTIDFN